MSATRSSRRATFMRWLFSFLSSTASRRSSRMGRLSGANLGRFSRRAVFATNSSQPMGRNTLSSCPSLALPALRITYFGVG